MTEGLKPLPHDDRDFKLGAIFTLPKLEELPETFELPIRKLLDQEANEEFDFCTAYATCGASSIQEEVDLIPRWSFAVSKMISGDKDAWGQDLRSAIKAHVQCGAVIDAWLDHNEILLSGPSVRDINNYRKELFDLAKKHKKETFFQTKGPYDAYDNIRASLWKFRGKKQAVIIGIQFGYGLDEYVLSEIKQGYGHCMYVIGWTKDGLIVVNSYGQRAGREGKHIVSRGVINQFVPVYGAYMMIDIPRETAEQMLDNGIRDTDEWYEEFYKIIKNICRRSLSKILSWLS